MAQLSTNEEQNLDIGEENKTETMTVEEEQVEKLDTEKIELERTRIIDEFRSSVDLGLSFENIEKARMTPSALSVGRIINKFERKIESAVIRMPSTECVEGETNDAVGLSLANCEVLKNEPKKEMEGGVTYDGLSFAEPSRVKTNDGKMMFGKHLMGGVNYDALSLAEPSGVNNDEGELPSEKYCEGGVICDALSLAEPGGMNKSEGEMKL